MANQYLQVRTLFKIYFLLQRSLSIGVDKSRGKIIGFLIQYNILMKNTIERMVAGNNGPG